MLHSRAMSSCEVQSHSQEVSGESVTLLLGPRRRDRDFLGIPSSSRLSCNIPTFLTCASPTFLSIASVPNTSFHFSDITLPQALFQPLHPIMLPDVPKYKYWCSHRKQEQCTKTLRDTLSSARLYTQETELASCPACPGSTGEKRYGETVS